MIRHDTENRCSTADVLCRTIVQDSAKATEEAAAMNKAAEEAAEEVAGLVIGQSVHRCGRQQWSAR